MGTMTNKKESNDQAIQKIYLYSTHEGNQKIYLYSMHEGNMCGGYDYQPTVSSININRFIDRASIVCKYNAKRPITEAYDTEPNMFAISRKAYELNKSQYVAIHNFAFHNLGGLLHRVQREKDTTGENDLAYLANAIIDKRLTRFIVFNDVYLAFKGINKESQWLYCENRDEKIRNIDQIYDGFFKKSGNRFSYIMSGRLNVGDAQLNKDNLYSLHAMPKGYEGRHEEFDVVVEGVRVNDLASSAKDYLQNGLGDDDYNILLNIKKYDI